MVAYPRHLLVVLEASAGDRGALDVADSAGRAGFAVTVLLAGTLRVFQRLRPLARGEDLSLPDAAESYVEAAAQGLRARGIAADGVYAPASDAAQAIAFHANRHDVGLILIPAAARTRGSHLRRGLAERLAAETTAPVVVLPPAPAPAEAA